MEQPLSLSEITPQDFGALGDNSHDDTRAVQNAINTALANSRNVFFPAGTYKLTSQVMVDLSKLFDPVAGAATNIGIALYGEGQHSLLSFQTSPTAYTSPLLVIQDNSSSVPEPSYPPPTIPQAANPFGSVHLRDLQIIGSTSNSTSPTPLVQIGRQDYRDTITHGHFTNLLIHNNAVSGSVVGPAMFVGFVTDSRFEGAFTSGNTSGLWICAAQYCRFLVRCLTQSTTSSPALYLTNSPNGAAAFCACNLFLNADCEGPGGSGVGLQIDGPQCYGNVFIAPYFNQLATGINATAGSSNRVIQPYYNSNVTTTVASTTGLVID